MPTHINEYILMNMTLHPPSLLEWPYHFHFPSYGLVRLRFNCCIIISHTWEHLPKACMQKCSLPCFHQKIICKSIYSTVA